MTVLKNLAALEYMAAADERVFGPPDGPLQGRDWEYKGLLITCWGCGVSWHGDGWETCWGCGSKRADRLRGTR